jgi:hypothetical protein
VAELAAELNLDQAACAVALRALAGRGALQLLIHPGGRYELRPAGRSS